MSIDIRQGIKIDENYYKVKEIQWLTDDTFVLRLPGGRFRFRAGQHVSLGMAGDYQSREYSIYNGENDECLEVLVKKVADGYFTPRLSKLKAGDMVEIHGPFGKFSLDRSAGGKYVFIASGTGIAPFRSMVRSYPGLDYLVVHGVRHGNEDYGRNDFDPSRHVLCTTGDQTGQYHGRLTGFLREKNFDKDTQFYLCGNSNMIFDALEILKEKGFTRNRLHCEVYF